MKWIRITDVAQVPLREGRTVDMPGLPLAVFNLGDRFVAVENRCPHSGGPLADGIVGGTTVTCPLHGWRVCLDSGETTKPCDAGVAPVKTFPVRIDEGILLVGLNEAEL